MKLTPKQERFCQEYIKCLNISEAYRRSYNTSKMKPASVNRKGYEVFQNVNVTSRIKELQDEVKERNKITVDELVNVLANMVRFDIADMYNDDGTIKPISEMDKSARMAIESLETEEMILGKVPVGEIKKLKMTNRRAAIDLLMKHLGGYEKDNKQKAITVLSPQDRIDRINELKSKLPK